MGRFTRTFAIFAPGPGLVAVANKGPITWSGLPAPFAEPSGANRQFEMTRRITDNG